jgi:hypothetical protein
MLSVNHYENDFLCYLLDLFSICTMVSPMILLTISYRTLYSILKYAYRLLFLLNIKETLFSESFCIGNTDCLQLSLSVLI